MFVMTPTRILTSITFVAAFAIAVPAHAGQRRGGSSRSAGHSRAGVAPRGGVVVSRGAHSYPVYRGGGGVHGNVYVARGYGHAAYYRPYYAFRPRLSLGFGLWAGYPVAYPSYYYPYGYAAPYPADPYAYGSPAPAYQYPTPHTRRRSTHRRILRTPTRRRLINRARMGRRDRDIRHRSRRRRSGFSAAVSSPRPAASASRSRPMTPPCSWTVPTSGPRAPSVRGRNHSA